MACAKRLTALTVAILLILSIASCAVCEGEADAVIPPTQESPDYVVWLLEIASNEVGYTEGDHGYSKYGEWAGDAYTQWCAEFLCWCVDQVDKQYGTNLLRQVYPMYGSSNVGKNWFISRGRYACANGNLDGWGYQWLKGEKSFMRRGDYIPQPGDWVFFNWTGTQDTEHVAMVEYCTQDAAGEVTIHVIEGNNPNAVTRGEYSLTSTRILGYGTVFDEVDMTLKSGNESEKVRQLQETLSALGYLDASLINGYYGVKTAQAVQAFQATMKNQRQSGIADIYTQAALSKALKAQIYSDPNTWLVKDDENI